MRKTIAFLLASASFLAQPALAEDAAAADEAMAADAAGDASDSDTITVVGQGQTRQVQELDQRALFILAPGTSALKAIENLPSVNFQSADPFGNYEWAQRVSIRGFNQNQIGFTLDGIPLGDASYGNVNGMHVSRAITTENIGVTRVSQGSGAIGTQATNNLGGTIEFLSADPEGRFGIDVSGSGGDYGLYRGFARVNVGVEDGPRGYVSYAYYQTDKWKGVGEQRQHMVNAKGVVPLGSIKLDGYFSYSDRRENDYQDLSLATIQRLGYKFDNISGDYALALLLADIGANRGDSGTTPLNPAAGKVYPAPFLTLDDAYFDAAGLRKDTLGAVGLSGDASESISFNLKGYYHTNKGRGLWFTPYVNSPTGVPISLRTTEYSIKRGGAFGSVTAKLGFNTLTAGLWFENNKFHQARRFYALASRTNPGIDPLKYPENPFATQWEFEFTTKTYQYHVEDSIELGPLTVNAGWKGFQVDIDAKPIVAAGFPTGSIRTRDWFQPHVGAVYKLNGGAEVFAGFTQVTRAFTGATTTGPFSTTQAGFNAIRGSLKPESSDTYELGLRYNSGAFHGMIGGYLVNFSNRLLAITTGAGIQGNPSVLQNVGGVRSAGFEALGDLNLGAGFKLFASYAYNDSTYRDNVVDGTGKILAATADKTVVDAPKHMARGEVSFDRGGTGLFARFAVNYMSKRYYTYLNDASVDGRAVFDAALGYRLNFGSLPKPIEVQLNATNLFDKQYVATIGTNGFVNSDPTGSFATLMAGAPQAVFITVKAGF